MAKRTEMKTLSVDPTKLSQGLKTTFLGVAMVFDSLGGETEEIGKLIGRMDGTASGSLVSSAPSDTVISTSCDPVMRPDSAEEPEDEERPTEKGAADMDDQPDEQAAADESAEAVEATELPVVTVEDITKVIVAKIKQKRSNNEAIGKLLKVYGAARVSELDPAKYEAFLTDISQL